MEPYNVPEQEVISTKQEIRDFQDSQIWQDILNCLDDVHDELRNALETAETWEEVLRLQAYAASMDMFRELPERLIADIEIQQQERENGSYD